MNPIAEAVARKLTAVEDGIYDDRQRQLRVEVRDGVCHTIRNARVCGALTETPSWMEFPDYPSNDWCPV